MSKKTVALIRGQDNHYLIRVKENQKTLYRSLEAISSTMPALSYCCEHECTRDRQTTRTVRVYDQLEGLDRSWEGLKQVVVVERKGWRGAAPYLEQGYYITSRSGSAPVLGQLIRRHWEIENRLHWVKDVVFEEDQTRAKKGQAPEKFSVLYDWVINIFRKHGMDSITRAVRSVRHDIDAMWTLLVT